MLPWRRRELALAIIVGLSLGASRDGVAACQSTCTQQLVACKEACPASGRSRRDCRAACAKRSTCTAPGARIRTLAYVVSECTTDPQGRSSLKQKLLVRRGNCDPVVVMEAATPTPGADPIRVCSWVGGDRFALNFVSPFLGARAVGVFQAVVVLPDGAGVIFDVSKQLLPLLPGLTPEPPEEGIFFVRADGSGLTRLGPPSRVSSVGFRWAASPDGRAIAFVDLGPDRAGDDKPQIFLLDLRSDDHTPRQLTFQSHAIDYLRSDPGVWLPIFLDNHTVGFVVGSTSYDITPSQVDTDGSGQITSIPPFDVPGGGVVRRFALTGTHPHAALGLFPDRPAEDDPNRFAREVFLTSGRNAKNLLQLTKFNRSDTGPGGDGARGQVIRGRVLFLATDRNGGENPHELCQLFSISTLGDDLRQLTHFPWDGRPSGQGCVYPAPACGIWGLSTAADHVTGTVLFSASCDPVGANPFGEQIFAMRPDGTGLRQLTDARGMTTDPDGTVHVELAGPFAYTAPSQP